jgi:hypothetical protein
MRLLNVAFHSRWVPELQLLFQSFKNCRGKSILSKVKTFKFSIHVRDKSMYTTVLDRPSSGDETIMIGESAVKASSL